MASSSLDPSFDFPWGAPVDPNAPVRSILGRDLYFDGNLAVNASEDYQTVEGEENYRRAIFRRLITSPGTYRARPRYGAGLGDFQKKKATKGNIDTLTTRVREQVAADRRTQKVLSVVIVDLPAPAQGIKVTVTVQAFGRTLRPLSYSFSKEA